MPEPAVAFLSRRKLHVRRDGVTRLLESEFERTVRERAASIERRNSWKSQGLSAMVMGRAIEPGSQTAVPVTMTGLAATNDGALLYTMETDAVSGVFLRDADGLETRLFHTADFRLRHAALDPAGVTLAATALHKAEFRANIAVLPLHGIDFTEVTEGDSFDQLPQWVPGPGRRIVFQSAGVGRDAAGRFAGLGPSAIQQVDLDSGDLIELASEDNHDLLQPRQTEDGTLYYIRRPWASAIQPVSLLSCLKDAAFLPFRIARAIFQYFNVFSMMYTGKPLVTGKAGLHRRVDPRQMLIHGNLAAALTGHELDDETQTFVPSSWELIRRDAQGRTEVIARNVLAFDVAGDGSVVYSDGVSISRLGADNVPQRIVQAPLIERVLAL